MIWQVVVDRIKIVVLAACVMSKLSCLGNQGIIILGSYIEALFGALFKFVYGQ